MTKKLIFYALSIALSLSSSSVLGFDEYDGYKFRLNMKNSEDCFFVGGAAVFTAGIGLSGLSFALERRCQRMVYRNAARGVCIGGLGTMMVGLLPMTGYFISKGIPGIGYRLLKKRSKDT